MEEKKSAQPEVSKASAREKPAPARGFAEPAQAGFDALPNDAPADVRARIILNLYPELFRALAKA